MTARHSKMQLGNIIVDVNTQGGDTKNKRKREQEPPPEEEKPFFTVSVEEAVDFVFSQL